MKKSIILILLITLSSSIHSQVTNITADITSNTTWTSGTYLVQNDIEVNDGITLTLNAGAIVKFENGVRLTVKGTIDANGVDGTRVFFTSKNDDSVGETITTSSGSPGKGDWNGIYLYGYYDPDGFGYFDYCTIKYGGGTSVSEPANVSNYHGYGYFKNCVSTESASYGYRHIPYATTIENSVFSSNASAGIYYECTDASNTPNISNNEFISNGNYAAIFAGTTFPILSNNSGNSNNTDEISVRGTVKTSQTLLAASSLPIRLANTVSISSGITLTFSSGTLIFGENYLNGSGTFEVGSGVTLQLGSADGIASGTTEGNIRTSGRTFAADANYIFNGSVAQITGSNFPLNAMNITINNASGVTLTNSVNVSGILSLTSGTLTTNSNILTLGSSTSNLGTLNITNGKIDGNFQRWFAASTVSDVEFPLEVSGNDRKVNISFTSAPTSGGTLLAKFVASDPGTNGLPINEDGKTVSECLTTGYWEITAGSGLSGGNYSLDLTAGGFSGVTDYTILRMLKRADSGSDWAFNGTHSATTGDNTTPILHRTGMSSFSNMAVAEANNTTPVELVAFNAKKIRDNILLSWTTATEVKNYGFNIERKSKIGSREWIEIGFVEGHGNSNSPNNYSFVDRDNIDGVVQYRLKQIDFDGGFEYSDIVAVENSDKLEFKLSQNYPNPFNPSTMIHYSIPVTNSTTEMSFVSLKVFDILGREVATLVNKEQTPGNYAVMFDASSKEIPSGIYFYTISTNGLTKVRKMNLIK